VNESKFFPRGCYLSLQMTDRQICLLTCYAFATHARNEQNCQPPEVTLRIWAEHLDGITEQSTLSHSVTF